MSPPPFPNPVFVALDTPDLDKAIGRRPRRRRRMWAG